MDFQYLTNEKGKRVSIVAPIKEWEKRDLVYQQIVKKKKRKAKKKVEDKYVPRTKQQILDGISRAVEEVKLIRAGKLKAKTLKEALNEL